MRDADMAIDSVAALLADEGYLDAAVRAEAGRLHILAGKQSTIASIFWIDDSTLQSGVNQPFTRENVEDLIDRNLGRYREMGYLYTSAAVTKVSRQGDKVSLEMRLNRGPLLTLQKNIYSGLKRTRPELIDKYLPVKSGQPLTERNLARAERRAAAIPFVNFEPPVIVRPQAGYTSADLEYIFSEKKQVLFSGGAGITPTGASNLTWNFDLRFQNFFGGGRFASLKSERRERGRQTLDVAYRQPVLMFGVGEAGLGVSTRDYRDQFYEFSATADYRSRLGASFYAGLELGWRSIEPAGEIPSYSSLSSAFMIEQNSLDNSINPSSGSKLVWTISFGYRRYSDDSLAVQPERNSFNDTRTTVQAEWYRRLWGSLVGQLSLNFRGLQTAESVPPLSELYYVGGPGTIRGYRNEQFTGIRTAFGTLEPRVRLSSGYFFVFYDGAYLANRITGADGTVATDEFYRSGYGLGAAIVSRGRILKMSLGWNPDVAFDEPRLSLEFSTEI
jgi:outer membrane protein assembly factor BamA